MGKKLVVANWKMHGNLAANKALLQAYIERLSPLKNTDIVVCVPYPYLAQAQSLLQNTSIAWGAQNLSKDAVGAYTGEVSAAMLKDFGTSYVIIGHSERATVSKSTRFQRDPAVAQLRHRRSPPDLLRQTEAIVQSTAR